MPRQARIESALGISYVNNLLEDAEREQGYVRSYRITLKPDAASSGHASPPGSPVRACQLTLAGVSGLVYTNVNDDYMRYDFVPDALVESRDAQQDEHPLASREKRVSDAEQEKAKARKTLLARAERESKKRESASADHASKLAQVIEFLYGPVLAKTSNKSERAFAHRDLERLVRLVTTFRENTGALPAIEPVADQSKSLGATVALALRQAQLANKILEQGYRPSLALTHNMLNISFMDVAGKSCLSEWKIPLVKLQDDPLVLDTSSIISADIYACDAESDASISVTELGRAINPSNSLFCSIATTMLSTHVFYEGSLREDFECGGAEWEHLQVLDATDIGSLSSLLHVFSPLDVDGKKLLAEHCARPESAISRKFDVAEKFGLSL